MDAGGKLGFRADCAVFSGVWFLMPNSRQVTHPCPNRQRFRMQRRNFLQHFQKLLENWSAGKRA